MISQRSPNNRLLDLDQSLLGWKYDLELGLDPSLESNLEPDLEGDLEDDLEEEVHPSEAAWEEAQSFELDHSYEGLASRLGNRTQRYRSIQQPIHLEDRGDQLIEPVFFHPPPALQPELELPDLAPEELQSSYQSLLQTIYSARADDSKVSTHGRTIDIQAIDIQAIDIPDMNLPDMNLPDLDIPDLEIPDLVPDLEIPDLEIPDLAASNIDLSDFDTQ